MSSIGRAPFPLRLLLPRCPLQAIGQVWVSRTFHCLPCTRVYGRMHHDWMVHGQRNSIRRVLLVLRGKQRQHPRDLGLCESSLSHLARHLQLTLTVSKTTISSVNPNELGRPPFQAPGAPSAELLPLQSTDSRTSRCIALDLQLLSESRRRRSCL